MTGGNCAVQIIAAFVRNPARAPDAVCIKQDATQVRFVTPANTIISRGIGNLQYNLLQGKIQYFIVPIISLVLLLSVWLIAPLAWVIRRVQKRPSEPQFLARLTPWLFALTSLIAAAFFAVLLILLVVVALQNKNTIGLVVGAPPEWLILYLLPMLFTLCALGLTIAIVLAWQRRNWGIPRRIYFSILTLAALALVAWFIFNGVLFPFFG